MSPFLLLVGVLSDKHAQNKVNVIDGVTAFLLLSNKLRNTSCHSHHFLLHWLRCVEHATSIACRTLDNACPTVCTYE